MHRPRDLSVDDCARLPSECIISRSGLQGEDQVSAMRAGWSGALDATKCIDVEGPISDAAI